MSEKLKIVYRPLQELSPYAHNARTHSTEQVAQLVESIKQFGWTNPVLIDEKGEIIAGHGRVMAAEMLKMDSVPVIVLSGLTDEQKKAYRLADNRLPMNAGWDEDLLRMELSDLINADFDVSLTGFIPTEIDELLTDVLPGTGNEEEPYTTKIDTPVYEPSGGKPDIAPPDIPAGFVAVFNSDEASWHLVEDHRGKTVYDVASGDALFISELGPLPENVTWLSPEGEFQKWNGTVWVKDTEAEKLFRIREAEETKNSLMQVASEHIAPLQDAADLEIATEEETSLLEAWKKYRVLLNRVNTTTAPDIEWPTVPIIE